MEQVWVMIRAQHARQRMLHLLDSGNLAEALGKKYYLDGMVDKMKSFVQQYGGNMTVAMYDCIAMQIPFNAAEQIPSITDGYNQALGGHISIGVGMTFSEAAKACKKSAQTGEIELFDASTDSFIKNESRRVSNPNVTIPGNIFSPYSPDDDYYQPGADLDVVMPPSAEEAVQIESSYIQALVAQMSPQQGPKGEPQGQQVPQDSDQAIASDESSQNTMELLNLISQKQASPEQKQEAEKELESEVAEAEQEAEGNHDEKLMSALQNVGSQIPQLMDLADKNPDAFKQSINMINKLIAFAKQRPQKQTQKMENILEQCEQLTKRFQERSKNTGPEVGANLDLPVGTRKKHYRKVLVDGKEVWRSFKTGQVKDDVDGSDISVRQYNVKQKQRQEQ